MNDAPEYRPPAPPDPEMMARAQAKHEGYAQRANNYYMNPEVNGPFGRVRYNRNQEEINGENVERPQQFIELNPEEQAAYQGGHAIRAQMRQAAGPLGENLMRGINDLNQMPYARPNFEGVEAAPRMGADNAERRRYEQAYYDRQMELMGPEMQRQEERLRGRLRGGGHTMGNEAYNNEMNRFGQERNQNIRTLGHEAILHGGQEQRNMYGLGQQMRGEQFQEAMRPYEVQQRERQGRMGENQFNLAALQGMLGHQNVNMPQIGQFNAAAQRAPDIGGMYQNNYNAQAQNYNNMFNQEQGNYRANMQGLYGLAGQGLGAAGGFMGGGGMFR